MITVETVSEIPQFSAFAKPLKRLRLHERPRDPRLKPGENEKVSLARSSTEDIALFVWFVIYRRLLPLEDSRKPSLGDLHRLCVLK